VETGAWKCSSYGAF